MSSTVIWPRVGRDPECLAFIRRVAQARADAFFAWGAFARRPAEAVAEFGDVVRTALSA
jgi:hypothetical protein